MLGEVLTAIVTPFKRDGSLDLDSFRALARHLVDNGSDGLVVTGTTGESPTLADDERFQLYAAALEEVGDRATVVAGTGHVRHPPLGPPDRAGARARRRRRPRHHAVLQQAAAARDRRPLRGRRGRDRQAGRRLQHPRPRRRSTSSPRRSRELAEIENVTAVKQANDDLAQAKHIVETGLDLYAGDDDLVLPFLELGGVGGVCVHTHVVGPQVKELIRLWNAGEHEAARTLDRELVPSIELLRVVAQPDRDQGGAEPARPRGRRPPAAARRPDGGRGRARARLPRPARPARSPPPS